MFQLIIDAFCSSYCNPNTHAMTGLYNLKKKKKGSFTVNQIGLENSHIVLNYSFQTFIFTC